MEQKIGSERYYQIAGIPIEPTAAVSKILWLKDTQPEIIDKTHTFASTQNVHLRQLGVGRCPLRSAKRGLLRFVGCRSTDLEH